MILNYRSVVMGPKCLINKSTIDIILVLVLVQILAIISPIVLTNHYYNYNELKQKEHVKAAIWIILCS